MSILKTLNARTPSKKIIEVLEEDGCVVIEGLLNDQEAQLLQSCMQKKFEKLPDCNGDFYGYETKRMGALFDKVPLFQKMAAFDQITDVMDHFLLKACDNYQINLTQAISIGPKEIKQVMHQDDPMFPFLHPEYEAMINCMWAVDDFTEENGATVLVPGSHKWPRSQNINLSFDNLPPQMITKGVMKKGSVLIYLGSLYHSGGANITDQRRIGAVISYCLGWLRQAENNYLAYSPEQVAQMPEKLKRMLGYFVHKPNLGSVNGIDPYDYISGKKGGEFAEFIPDMYKPMLKEYNEQQREASSKFKLSG